MKRERILVAVLAATLGCTGVIDGPGNDAATGPAPGGVGGRGPDTAACSETDIALVKPRAWRLTTSQLSNTLRDRLGFVPPAITTLPAEARIDGFANRSDDLKISPLLADGYYVASEELAAEVVANPAKYGTECALASLASATCLSSFVSGLGERMWRRPLIASEVSSLSALYVMVATQPEGTVGGVKAVVQALFLSPHFLHRSELGAIQDPGALTPLSDYEIASALSYTLWDTAPDAALLELAKEGKLRDKTVLVEQAKRLLGDASRASSAIHHFIQQWLFIDNLLLSDKDLDVFSFGTHEAAADLLEENRLFVNSVLFDPGADRSFKTLFTAPYGFVNARTAPIYGLQDVTSSALVRRELNPSERRGVLTLPSFLWAHADPDGTRLVDRGAYFRAEILCDRVPPPPGGVLQDAAFAADDATGRERFVVHNQPACAGCHQLFDSIGFALESYDGIGRFRTTDHGKLIDPSGAIPLPSRGDGPDLAFTNFVDLVDKLAQEPDIYSCFAGQYLTYAFGRHIDALDQCEKKRVAEHFISSDYKIDALILGIVASPSFVDRRN